LEISKIVLERRCKSFGSSDRSGVGGCGSQSGARHQCRIFCILRHVVELQLSHLSISQTAVELH